ncbi:MAG: thioredoxin family protein [Helicobacter sp.]|nr:thioredoxin family protein [Helicobacteraceae bacterium]MDY3113462.1 thioredoxin family protein [Helicobacter sp.]
MKNKVFMFFCCFVAFIFVACRDEADESFITSGTNYSKEKHLQMENIDRNSYAEVADVFLETSVIKSDGLPYLLIFGANGCVYCDRLKNIIKEDSKVKDILKTNYSPYYINISYTKTHKIDFLNASLNTIELAQKYGIKPTPTIIFLSKNGDELFVYPGFMPKERFIKTLEFFKDSAFDKKNLDSIKQELQAHWATQGV